MKALSVLFAALVVATLFAVAADQSQPPAVGTQAPAFSLPSQEGAQVSLDQFRGKWVVLYFYPKDGTTGCTIEAHNFQQDLSKYEAAKAVIVGVSVDSTDSHKDFCAKQGLTFKLLADTDKKVVDEFGSLGANGVASRNTFLIDPSGKIVKVWTRVNPNVHSKEVLETLESMEK